ncbi:Multiple epidermal growth factor-like domains protein 9 [Bagarius yarrelli]|uniref:Multiple epidermal growth factor-like domains protein 9 n=1 Tax=Bagarius yarrelli TaxID=175774 RepID=A0A556VVJ8_BAGYA|nr:Multiple epidermal growth factor-like domains protein 9 [Bagarius yarrelli]
MMMSASPAFSLLALACLGWSCAHDAVRKPRQILSSGDADSQSIVRVGASFTGLTPAPTVLPAQAQISTSISIQPSTNTLREDAAPLELHKPKAARLLAQRRRSSVSDKAQDAGLITTSDNSQELVCNCSTEGVLEPEECDRDTGQCVCMTGYTGLQCEECEEDHFSNGTVGCLPCGCDSFGAVTPGCDSVCQATTEPQVEEMAVETSVCPVPVPPTALQAPATLVRHATWECVRRVCEKVMKGVCMWRTCGKTVFEECFRGICARGDDDDDKGDSTVHVVCDECKAGFAPPTCEVCTDGFYKSGSECVRCECNENADPRSAPSICHPETGRCLLLKASSSYENIYLQVYHFTSPGSSLRLSPASVGHSKAPPLHSGPGDPTTSNSTASALAVVSWTQFNVIILAVIIVLLVLLMGFVGAVYTYREYRNRKLNAPFWTIELKEDNISFSSYHDSIPHAEPGVLLEEEQCSVPSNGQLALASAASVYKA